VDELEQFGLTARQRLKRSANLKLHVVLALCGGKRVCANKFIAKSLQKLASTSTSSVMVEQSVPRDSIQPPLGLVVVSGHRASSTPRNKSCLREEVRSILYVLDAIGEIGEEG